MVEKKSDKRRLFVSSILITAATVIEKIAFFLINIIIARYLTKDLYGEYTTALGFATFFSLFTNLGLGVSIYRAINIDHEYRNQHYSSSLVIKIALSVLVFIVMVFSLKFTGYNSNTVYLAIILGIVRIGNDLMALQYALFEASERFKITSFFTSTFSISFLASTVLIVILKGDYFHFAYARLIIVVVYIMIIFIIINKVFKFSFNYGKFIEFIKRSYPYALSSLFLSVIQNFGVFILPLMMGTVLAGIYNNANIFFISLIFIPGNMLKVLMPYLYKIDLKTNHDKFQFTFNIYSKSILIIAIYFSVIFILFSKDIILLFFGIRYYESINVLIAFAYAIPFAFSPSAAIIATMDKQEVNVIIETFVLTVCLVSSYVFIKYMGAIGAALAVVLAYILLYIFATAYIVFKQGISYSITLINFLKLILILFICWLSYVVVLKELFFIISAMIISIEYLLLVILFMVRGNDIKVIKEILFSSKTL